MKTENVQFLIIDLFCGAGGVTTGFEQATIHGAKISKVIACVNHDAVAIKSHYTNHRHVHHFTEDIRTMELTELKAIVKRFQSIYPSAKLILHASLECTNFSKAKGGKPRLADSRTLADHLPRYIQATNPDYVTIENVVEFMAWGPLDENGKPVSKKNGTDWLRWKQEINSMGYRDEWKELNSANLGAFTSRNRLFGIFAKHGLPISFPEATHAKNPEKLGMFGQLKKWKAVREVLNLEDKGESIFTRKKPLSEKTLQRVYAGLIKFVAGGKENFLTKTYAVASNSHGCTDTEKPSTCITTRDAHQIVQPQFISKYYSGRPENKNIGITGPAGTIKTIDSQALVSSEFLTVYHANSSTSSIDKPSPTISTKDGYALVQPQFISRNFSTGPNSSSINAPSGSILSNPKLNLVTAEPYMVEQSFNNGASSINAPAKTILACRKNHYLVNPQWGGNAGDIDSPCCTLIARQDKAPVYLVTTDEGLLAIEIYESDSEYTALIKKFMAMYGIVDIKMRMLRIDELLRIQGFPKEYKLEGTQTQQKKHIGNSVVPKVIKSWAESLAVEINNLNLAA